MRPTRTAAGLIIGDEILSGKIREANVFELARVLRNRGVELARVVVIPDSIPVIVHEVQQLSKAYDHVFTSGGVGPTHDDVTIAAIAEAFDVPVVRDPDLERVLRDYYGDDVTENHLLLANVPEGVKKLRIARTPWPLAVIENVWILPGIPEVFRMKLEIVHEHLEASAPFVTRSVFTKLDEAALKPFLDETVSQFPKVAIGSYPRWQDPKYETKVTFDGTDKDAVERAFEDFQHKLPDGEPQWTE